MKRSRIGLTAGLAVAVLIAGCNSNSGGAKPSKTLKELGKDEKASIKVVFWDKNSFFQQYGNLFSAKFPNIDVQVVSTQGISLGNGKDMNEEFQKLVDDEKPDVLMFQTPDMFETWANDGKLYQLDDVIRQDKFDIENILPSLVEQIKAKGNGNIYGLTPSFYSQALFYNKDLFEKHGVPLPKNKMTWNEVLDLAKRFPKDGQGNNRIYGFAQNSSYAFGDKKQLAYQYMNNIGLTSGLSVVDPDKGTVTVQSDGWKNALVTTVEALKSGAVFPGNDEKFDPNKSQTMEDYYRKDLFATGRVAMSLEYSFTMGSLQRTKEVLKDVTPVNWDIVTVPVDPKNPDVSNSVSLSGLFAVNANTSNPRAAWELVKYINSEEMAKLQAKSEDGSLLSRTAYVKERDGHSMEPFYMLKMSENNFYKNFGKIPMGFDRPFRELAGTEIMSVVEGKKSVDDALKTMQDKGQEFYIKAKQEQDAKDAKEGKDQKPAEPAKN
ncbi:extracellular solute-binding protein [Paenibacillus sp. MZ04-78.2]|uniref:ABC transporter substrate-binding protein n=1 Tax=Paenibacillus sp. MZ04-78.2 TaxID=2962034 RepID=UPI0020B6917A|nr:extracellular solute-binding protein [Paenibacillus sp. MZ04-78.2]MCP3772287.1 extracellular solute-binding protein [Paenibacillus sp. MZ04-78.2]